MANINLKLLHTFLLAAEKESFRRAADAANRSPSAISLQIRELEEQIGVVLFVRTSRRVLLTQEGQTLLAQVKKTVMDVNMVLDQLSEAAQRKRGYIVIACAPTLASSRMPNILANFKIKHPSVVVGVQEIPTEGALDLLESEKVDFFIGPPIPDMADFEFDAIGKDPLVACIPPAFDLGQKEISIGSLVNTPLILLNRTTATRGIIDRISAGLGVQLHAQYEVQNAITAIALAEAGLGVAIVPKGALRNANVGQSRIVALSNSGAYREVGVITRRGLSLHLHSQQLIKLIRSSLQMD
jgi:DNA-binding transcriptional LysR family regulator